MTLEDHCLFNNSDWQGALFSFANVTRCGICKSTPKGPGCRPRRTPVSAGNLCPWKSGSNNRVTFHARFYLHFHSIQPRPGIARFGRRWLQNCFIGREGTKQGCDKSDAKFTEKGLNCSHSPKHEAISDSRPNH